METQTVLQEMESDEGPHNKKGKVKGSQAQKRKKEAGAAQTKRSV